MSPIEDVSAGQPPQDAGAAVADPAAQLFSKDQQDWIKAAIMEGFQSILPALGGPMAPGGGPHMGDMGGKGPPLRTGTPLNPHNPGTPNNDFIHGVKGKLLYTMEGVTTPVAFPVEMFSIDEVIETDDITNTSSNGWKVKLDGLHEITGNVTFVYDALAIPGTASGLGGTGPANPFRPRIFCTLNLKPDGQTTIIVPALISSLSYSSGPKAGTVRVTCKYESSGECTVPTASQTTATPMLL